MRWGFYFPDQHTRLFSRNAATPSCASAAVGVFGHDLSSIRVHGRLIDVNLRIVSLFTDLDNERTRLGDPVGPVSQRQNRMWRLTLLGALLAVAVTQSANSSYSASALHLGTEYC
jgi:hypothetical protein